MTKGYEPGADLSPATVWKFAVTAGSSTESVRSQLAIVISDLKTRDKFSNHVRAPLPFLLGIG